MPKKTKRQKLHADTHRTVSSSLYSLPSQSGGLLSLPTGSPRSFVARDDRLSWSDYSSIRHGLVRISLFTFLALLANGMLYFLTNQ